VYNFVALWCKIRETRTGCLAGSRPRTLPPSSDELGDVGNCSCKQCETYEQFDEGGNPPTFSRASLVQTAKLSLFAAKLTLRPPSTHRSPPFFSFFHGRKLFLARREAESVPKCNRSEPDGGRECAGYSVRNFLMPHYRILLILVVAAVRRFLSQMVTQ